jgi:cytoskeletal protein CcmA (bactofilin family)
MRRVAGVAAQGASIIGDVRYEVLEMHPGATIDGELRR